MNHVDRMREYYAKGFSKNKIKKMLPRVGQRLTREPKWSRMDVRGRPKALPCKVIYVNEDHGWYLVEYIGLGIREAFKIVDTVCKEDDDGCH